ncbi:hypothetical protein ACIP6I_35050 [Streptomyces anulatus]
MRESAFAHLHRFRLLWIRWETGDDVPEAFFASERAHSSAGGACTAGPGPRPGNRGTGALAPPLTDPDFTDHIRTLIATEHTPTRTRLQPRPKTSQPKIVTARNHCTWAWG